MIKFVQSGELNRYVDDSIPLTWKKRWEALRVGFPILIFCGAAFVPSLVLIAILEQSWAPIQGAVILLISLPLVLVLIFEITLRVHQRSKRILVLKDNRIVFHTGNNPKWVRWCQVAAVRFEPIPETAEHCVALVEAKTQKGRAGRPWAMVLPWRDVKSLLVPELNRRMKENRSDFEIEFRDRPTRAQPRLRLPMLWFFALGMFFFVHGMPLLGVGLAGLARTEKESREPQARRENRRDDKLKFSPEAEKRIERFLVNHVRSVDRLNELYLWFGGTLTAVGILLAGYDFRRLGKVGNERLAKAAD